MEIRFDRLEKLANALLELDPMKYHYNMGTTLITNKHKKPSGGCAWGYSTQVFPDELVVKLCWTGGTIYAPHLMDDSTGMTWNDCCLFFGLNHQQVNEIFHHNEFIDLPRYEPMDTYKEIMAFCEREKNNLVVK